MYTQIIIKKIYSYIKNFSPLKYKKSLFVFKYKKDEFIIR